jgi:hypothetical protein
MPKYKAVPHIPKERIAKKMFSQPEYRNFLDIDAAKAVYLYYLINYFSYICLKLQTTQTVNL